jgi:hypothetical protein
MRGADVLKGAETREEKKARNKEGNFIICRKMNGTRDDHFK